MPLKKKMRIIAIILVAPVCLFWLFSLARCEILTWLHGDEFATAYQENSMINPGYWKVLDYTDTYARVYFVTKYRLSGNILTFRKLDDTWVYDTWEETVWSKTGSADGFVWPYIR